MPVQQDGVYATNVKSGTFKIKTNGKCDMVDFLTEGLELASGAISQCSLRQLSEEIEGKTLSGLLDQLALSIHCFDAARSLSAYTNLRLLLPEMDEKLAGCTTEQEMTPIFKVLAQKVRIGVSENEQCMKDFAFVVIIFLDKTMMRAKKQDDDIALKINVVKQVVNTWSARCSIREATWAETKVLHRLVAADILDEAKMLEGLCTDGDEGYLSLVVELATLRRGLQHEWDGPLEWANDYDHVMFVDHAEQDQEWTKECNAFFKKFVVGETPTKIIAAALTHRLAGSVRAFADSASILFESDLDAEREAWETAESAAAALKKFLGDQGRFTTLVEHVKAARESSPAGATCRDAMPGLPLNKTFDRMTTLLLLGGTERVQGSGLDANVDSWPTTTLEMGALITLEWSEALHVMAYVVDAIIGKKILIRGVVDGKNCKFIDPSLPEAVNDITQLAQGFRGKSNAFVAMPEHEAFRVPIAKFDALADVIGGVWIPMLKGDFMAATKVVIQQGTEQLTKATPQYQHILSKTKYNNKLAKTQLLDNRAELDLPGKTNDLFYAVSSASKLFTEWGANAAEVSEFVAAEGAIDAANLTGAVIGGVNIVEEWDNKKDGKTMAKNLLDKKFDLPGALKERLKKIAEK